MINTTFTCFWFPLVLLILPEEVILPEAVILPPEIIFPFVVSILPVPVYPLEPDILLLMTLKVVPTSNCPVIPTPPEYRAPPPTKRSFLIPTPPSTLRAPVEGLVELSVTSISSLDLASILVFGAPCSELNFNSPLLVVIVWLPVVVGLFAS